MAVTFSKQKLSASTNGKAIKVAAVATLGTLIHAAHATALDEIWLYAYNNDASPRDLTLEFGGAASPDNLIFQTVPSKAGLMLVVPGLILSGGLSLTAFASLTNVITLTGYVNRIL